MNDNQNPPGSAINTAPKRSASEIVEQMVGEVIWMDGAKGYCACPGRCHHTNQDGQRDCAIYLNGVPTLYCVHSSCKTAVDEANKTLRKAIMDGCATGEMKPLDKDEKAERARRERIRKRAAAALPSILEKYRWPYADIIAGSPVTPDADHSQHWKALLNRFQPDDVVWIGDKYDSGKPEHAAHFKSVAQWLQQDEAPGQLICPAVFKDGCIARSNTEVTARRFLVIESDTLTKDQVGAIFCWLKDVVKMQLEAIIDTAGKSLHGWFKYPPDGVVEELKLTAPMLGCDPKLFTPSQPVRLPGALRDGKYQKLVYLGSEVAK